MSLLILIGIIWLIVSHYRLSSRVSLMEEKLSNGLIKENTTAEKPTNFSPIPKPDTIKQNIVPLPEAEQYNKVPLYEETNFTPAAIAEVPKKDVVDEMEIFLYRWFKEHTLIKIGGIIFFLGMAWFVSYAIDSGWIIEEVRIAFGFLLAGLFYVLGFVRQGNVSTQYVILTALGTGIVCVTVAAAQMVFEFFHPLFALCLLSISIGYTLFVAWKTANTTLVLTVGAVGLLAPMLVGGISEALFILMYLFVLSASLLLVGFLLDSRAVTLLLVSGVFLYEADLLSFAEPSLLWFFVVLFSILFFASTTNSLVRSLKPNASDITTLVIASIGFVFFASEISASASLATFIATLIVAVTGYVLLQRHVPLPIIMVYGGFAAAGLLMATSFLFSGSTLALAFIFEITAAFFLVTALGLPKKVIYTVALAYVLPLMVSYSSFYSLDWKQGISHQDAWVLYVMTFALYGSALWLIHKKDVMVQAWSRKLAAVFGVLGFLFLYGVIATVMDSLFAVVEARAMTYTLWGVVSLAYLYYSLKQNFPLAVVYCSAFSLALPLLLSISSFSPRSWLSGVNHPDGFGVFGMFAILLVTTLLLTQRFCKEYDSNLKQVLALFLVVTIGYLFAIFAVLWQGLLGPSGIAHVAIYMSYACVLYTLTSLFVLLRAGTTWILWSLLAFTIPVLISFQSFFASSWESDVFNPDAVGLYGLTAILLMIALGLRNKYASENVQAEIQVKNWSKVFFVLAFLYAIGLVWSIAHSMASANQAVSLALFVYTVAGLWSYQSGKRSGKKDFIYVGTALLSLVVLRLIAVDVWAMEPIWRIITFLGIGFLFIGTALLERLPEKK